jgi:hypothetical protein
MTEVVRIPTKRSFFQSWEHDCGDHVNEEPPRVCVCVCV